MVTFSRIIQSCFGLRIVALGLLVFQINDAAAAPDRALDRSLDRIPVRIEEAARSQLAKQAERAGLLDPQFEVTVLRNSQQLPACQEPVNIDSLDTRQPSRMRFEVFCPGADGWRREFIVRAQVSARVLVVAADIPAGQALTAADLMLERRTLPATPDTVSALPEAVGMSARRALHAGDTVRKSWLTAPILVKRGDAVRILANIGQIEVSVAGVALEGGANGAIVNVRNATSGNVIRARIIANATVEPIDIPASIPAHSPDGTD